MVKVEPWLQYCHKITRNSSKESERNSFNIDSYLSLFFFLFQKILLVQNNPLRDLQIILKTKKQPQQPKKRCSNQNYEKSNLKWLLKRWRDCREIKSKNSKEGMREKKMEPAINFGRLRKLGSGNHGWGGFGGRVLESQWNVGSRSHKNDAL